MVMLEVFKVLHFLGIAFGLGGATLAAIISRKAEKDKDIGKAFMKIIPSISKLIWLGLILLIISGIGLIKYVKWPLDTQLLILKHALVLWIVIFGIIIGFKAKKMKKMAELKKQEEIAKAKKQMRIFSIINLILWYAVTILSAFV